MESQRWLRMYNIKRSSKIVDELNLCDENGNVIKTIKINIDIYKSSSDFHRAKVNFLEAQRQCVEHEGSYEDVGSTMRELYRIIFGDDNLTEIENFFENNLEEMFVQTLPYINDVVIPQFQHQRKEMLKKLKK